MSFKWETFFTYLPLLWKPALVTLELSLVSMLFGTCIGMAMASLKLSRSKVAAFIARIYVDVIRGVPLLVQILWLFFGMALLLGINLTPNIAGIISLSIWSGAYFTEIFRGGLLAIQKTQHYAAYSIGMTPFQSFQRIIFPQAFRRILPPYISQLIVIIKYSSFLSVINVAEITKRADTMAVALYSPFEIYLAAAVVYFVILIALSLLGKKVEKRLRVNMLGE